MFFKLVAALFLVVNGQVAEKPVATFANNTHFASEEACMNYFDTDAGKNAQAQIDLMIKREEEAYTVKYACVKQIDGSI